MSRALFITLALCLAVSAHAYAEHPVFESLWSADVSNRNAFVGRLPLGYDGGDCPSGYSSVEYKDVKKLASAAGLKASVDAAIAAAKPADCVIDEEDVTVCFKGTLTDPATQTFSYDVTFLGTLELRCFTAPLEREVDFSGTAPTATNTCPTCVAGTSFRQNREKKCNPYGDFTCTPCTTCEPGTFAKEQCKLDRDTKCQKCKKCERDQFASSVCSPFGDTNCAKCNAEKIKKNCGRFNNFVPCTPFSDAKCI